MTRAEVRRDRLHARRQGRLRSQRPELQTADHGAEGRQRSAGQLRSLGRAAMLNGRRGWSARRVERAADGRKAIQFPGGITTIGRCGSTAGRCHRRTRRAEWNGYSVGRWEGNTLDGRLAGIRPADLARPQRIPSQRPNAVAGALRLLDAETLELRMTITDPGPRRSRSRAT